MSKALISSLQNGLRVITYSTKTVETVSIGAWINVGTRDESASINGISHVLEHMAFKGTKRRNAYDIASEIESVGGHLNAYTSRENTAYYAKVMKDDVALAVDLIGDIIQNSTMEPDELTREKTVIIQEINQTIDTPDDIIFDHFQEKAYPDQSIGRSILGSTKLVQGFTPKALIDYMDTFYCPSQIIVSAVGNLDHQKLVNLISYSFGNLKKRKEKIH